jgi:hypothetical protein
MNFKTVSKREVRKALLAACANLIRSVIKTADFPELVARIERRNADLKNDN